MAMFIQISQLQWINLDHIRGISDSGDYMQFSTGDHVYEASDSYYEEAKKALDRLTSHGYPWPEPLSHPKQPWPWGSGEARNLGESPQGSGAVQE